MSQGPQSRDYHLLEQAWFEAEKAGWLSVAPNPRVGALALKDGHVIGRGFHTAFGEAHAEEMALRDADAWCLETQQPLAGIVDEMVVTLEPCSSNGPAKKRPACASLLEAAGVQKVLVGAVDPNPLHAGAGLEVLRSFEIKVRTLESFQIRFEESNPAFLRALAHPDRPWVLLKWAASLDGKTASDSGSSQWITGAAAREEVHQLRKCSCAVMAGAGTVKADNPSLTARGKQGLYLRQPKRVVLGVEPVDLASDASLLAEGGELLAYTTKASGEREPLSEILLDLKRNHGIARLLVEGGAHLHGELLDAGLADAVVVYEAPLLVGGHFGACLGAGFPSPAEGVRLAQEERLQLGDDLRRAFLICD